VAPLNARHLLGDGDGDGALVGPGAGGAPGAGGGVGDAPGAGRTENISYLDARAKVARCLAGST